MTSTTRGKTAGRVGRGDAARDLAGNAMTMRDDDDENRKANRIKAGEQLASILAALRAARLIERTLVERMRGSVDG